jgi:hypothetical protein
MLTSYIKPPVSDTPGSFWLLLSSILQHSQIPMKIMNILTTSISALALVAQISMTRQ